MICAYCWREKPDEQITDEHVLPRALGGNLTPQNPFLLRPVCKICNAASGRHIDGPFLRSWFLKNYRAENARKYVDLSVSPILPLTYLGEVQTDLPTDKSCDMWLGPTDDRVFHFHNPYPNAEGVVGPPLYLRPDEIDPGFVFVFIRATNPAWHGPILLSIKEYFPESTLYVGNGSTPPGGAFSDVPEKFNALHSQLKAMNGQTHHLQFHVRKDFGHRFLAKLALGCGALFLKRDFLWSPDATLLRNFMWEKTPGSRQDIPLLGQPFLSEKLKGIKQILGWAPGHIILFSPIDHKLVLVPIFYGEHVAAMQICSDATLWEGQINPLGSVYIIAPGLRRFYGPMSLPDFIAIKTGMLSTSNECAELLNHSYSECTLPPYDLPPVV